MTRIFEAKIGQPVSAQYLPEGSDEKIWESTPNRIFLGKDGRIYLPADDGARILNQDGIYIGDIVLKSDMDINVDFVKRMVGLDEDDRLWYYVPYYLTSAPFPGDYRHHLLAFDKDGKLTRTVKLEFTPSKRKTYRGQIVKRGIFFMRNSDGGYLVDSLGKTLDWNNCGGYDALGNGLEGSHDWNDEFSANQLSLRIIPADQLGIYSSEATADATALNEYFKMKASEGVSYFALWAGTNRTGHIAYSLSGKPPGGQLNNSYFGYVIYDVSSDQIIDNGRCDWDVPPNRAPRVLFRQLEDDNTILIGVEMPDTPWKVETDGTGITGTRIYPGPGGLTFQIYRLKKYI